MQAGRARAAQGLLRFSRSLSALPNTAYVFDIDGVLIRGGSALSAGVAALSHLRSPSAPTWRVPVAFLTNGGGHSEATRAAILSRTLGIPVNPEHVILSHSPMQRIAAERRTRPGLPRRSVVVMGGNQCADVARSYGWKDVIDVASFVAARGGNVLVPFGGDGDGILLGEQEKEVANLPVGDVLVMSDSGMGFHRDLQVLVDCVEEDVRVRPERLRVLFANPDLVFPNEHLRPRLAGGVLKVALDAVLNELKGSLRRVDYETLQFGKPNSANYHMAESALLRQSKENGAAGDRANDVFERIYMVGDNPPSDVRGARNRGRPWYSILVRSGNFNGEGNCPVDPADFVVEDAEEAVTSTRSW